MTTRTERRILAAARRWYEWWLEKAASPPAGEYELPIYKACAADAAARKRKVRKWRAKQRVLREFPSAWFNRKTRQIEGYSESLVLGRGSVLARSIEDSAWQDAAANLKLRRK